MSQIAALLSPSRRAVSQGDPCSCGRHRCSPPSVAEAMGRSDSGLENPTAETSYKAQFPARHVEKPPLAGKLIRQQVVEQCKLTTAEPHHFVTTSQCFFDNNGATSPVSPTRQPMNRPGTSSIYTAGSSSRGMAGLVGSSSSSNAAAAATIDQHHAPHPSEFTMSEQKKLQRQRMSTPQGDGFAQPWESLTPAELARSFKPLPRRIVTCPFVGETTMGAQFPGHKCAPVARRTRPKNVAPYLYTDEPDITVSVSSAKSAMQQAINQTTGKIDDCRQQPFRPKPQLHRLVDEDSAFRERNHLPARPVTSSYHEQFHALPLDESIAARKSRKAPLRRPPPEPLAPDSRNFETTNAAFHQKTASQAFPKVVQAPGTAGGSHGGGVASHF